jgi:DNA polymerase-3 subunit epsilon
MENFIAIDFETATGKRSSMCAIGLVVVKNNSIVEKIWALIQPPDNNYHPMNTRVNHITPALTENAPLFNEYFPKLKNYLQNQIVVCHNSEFDIDVLLQTLNYYNIDHSDLNISTYCTFKIFGEKLNNCCEKYNININHHNPLSDAEACAKLFIIYNSGQNCITEYINPDNSCFDNNSNETHKISGSVLKPDLENVHNTENPFYGKKVVIIGTYTQWPDRKELAELMKKLGADVDGSVTDRTNYLITGESAGPSKIKKMISNIENGKDAAILTENMLIDMLK